MHRSSVHAGRARRAGRLFSCLVALSLVAVACGSKLGEGDLRAAAAAGGTTDLAGSGSISEQLSASAGSQSGLVTGPGAPSGAEASRSGGPSGTGRGPTATKSEIRLGSYGTQSGIFGASLAPMHIAARAWVADVNARGGLDGHPVRLIIRDDKGDPGIALSVARRMAEEDKVLAFFASFAATTQQAVTPYLEREKIPLIGGAPHQDADSSPMIFNPQASVLATFRGNLANVVAQTPARKIAVLYCREAASCQNAEHIMREYAPILGAEIVYTQAVSVAQPDYSAEVIQARNSGADALIMNIDYPSGLRIIRSARRQGWEPVFAGGTAPYDPEFIEAGREDVEGVLALATVDPYSLSPRMKPYRDAVTRHVPGGKIADFGAAGWVAGKLLERIAPSLGEPPTRAQLFRGLYSLRNETLGGIVAPLTFPRGPHRYVNMCVVPLRISRGAFVAPLGDGRFACSTDEGLRRI